MPEVSRRTRANLVFELATPETEDRFRQLLRDNPLAGNIHVSLTREPDAFHAASISGDVKELLLAYRKEPRDLIGGFGRFELDAYVNGEAQRIGYIGELRIQGGLKQRRTALLEGYRALRRLHESGNAPYYITTVISDNRSTRRLLEAGLGDMPAYQPLEEIVTLTIPTRKAARLRVARMSAEQSASADLDAIAERLRDSGREHQFHPVWKAGTLRSGNRCRGISSFDFCVIRDANGIRALACLWDQRKFKQALVSGYSKPLGRARPFFNLVAPMLRQPRLPPPGSQIQSAFLSHLSVDPGDDAAFLALVRHAAQQAAVRGIDYLMLGLAKRNPLCRIIERRLSCHRYASMLYLVYWQDGGEHARQLDERIPHPEMAIL